MQYPGSRLVYITKDRFRWYRNNPFVRVEAPSLAEGWLAFDAATALVTILTNKEAVPRSWSRLQPLEEFVIKIRIFRTTLDRMELGFR